MNHAYRERAACIVNGLPFLAEWSGLQNKCEIMHGCKMLINFCVSECSSLFLVWDMFFIMHWEEILDMKSSRQCLVQTTSGRWLRIKSMRLGVCQTRSCHCRDACNRHATHLLDCYVMKTRRTYDNLGEFGAILPPRPRYLVTW